uniref:Uncharacterized protein n=1 Tax=Globodera rostochiensis TaxID=31243 RepID=A0A914HRD7_GLORO
MARGWPWQRIAFLQSLGSNSVEEFGPRRAGLGRRLGAKRCHAARIWPTDELDNVRVKLLETVHRRVRALIPRARKTHMVHGPRPDAECERPVLRVVRQLVVDHLPIRCAMFAELFLTVGRRAFESCNWQRTGMNNNSAQSEAAPPTVPPFVASCMCLSSPLSHNSTRSSAGGRADATVGDQMARDGCECALPLILRTSCDECYM